jgi:glycosyltransferase involved in cell wall biosynthesis
MKFVDVWMPAVADHGVTRHIIRLAFFCTQLAYQIHRLTRTERVDIIHTHSQFSAGTVLAARKLFGWDVRIVHTVHNPWILYEDFEHRYGTMVERWALRQVDHVTVPTKDMQNTVIGKFGVAPPNVSRVRMGIDLDDVHMYLQKQPRESRKSDAVLCTARISRRKNQMAILCAVPAVLAAFPQARFVFCGPVDDQGYFRELQRFVQQHRLGQHIVFTGAIPKEELYDLYRGAALFVLPSLVEVQPVALLEALAFGLPVVASRIAPHEEVLAVVGGHIILVNPEEAAELAQAIVELLRTGGSPNGSSSGWDELMTPFSWRSSAGDVEEVYSRLVAVGRTTRKCRMWWS